MFYYGEEGLSLDSYKQFKEIAAPTTPQSDEIRQYAFDSAGISTMCWKNDAGNVTCLGTAGGTVPTGGGAGVSGAVAFWNGVATLGQDATQLFWDDTNNRLGIGTATPTVKLDVNGAAADTRIQLLAGGTADTSFQLGRTTIDGSFSVAGLALSFSNISAVGDTIVRAVAGSLISTVLNGTGNFKWSSGSAGADTEKMTLTNAGLLGIGITAPASSLHDRIASTSDTVIHERYGTSAGGGFTGRGSRGSIASPTQVLADDNLVGLFGQGRDNAGSFSGNSATVQVKAGEAFTATARGAYITFETTPLLSTTRAVRFRVGESGQFGIGGATYGTAGQVFTSGGASAAPTWSAAGSGTVTGSGTAVRVAFWDGASSLSSDADLTFSTDTLTATKIVAPTSIVSPLIIGGTTSLSTLSLFGSNHADGGQVILNSDTIVTASTNYPAISINPTFTGSGDGPQAVTFAPIFQPSGNISDCYSFLNIAKADPTTGVTITRASAGYFRVDTGSAGGALSNLFGLEIAAPSYGSVKPANSYGLVIRDVGVAGATESNCIYLTKPTGSTNNYYINFDTADATGNITPATGRLVVNVGGTLKYIRYYDS